jgi:hypothetical protein
VLEHFWRHLRRRRCRYGHSQPKNQLTGASLFLKHLCATGFISSPRESLVAQPALLGSFRDWMREQRGTHDKTLDHYNGPILALLKHVGEDPKHVDAQDLRQCSLKYCDGKGYAVIKHGATALR